MFTYMTMAVTTTAVAGGGNGRETNAKAETHSSATEQRKVSRERHVLFLLPISFFIIIIFF